MCSFFVHWELSKPTAGGGRWRLLPGRLLSPHLFPGRCILAFYWNPCVDDVCMCVCVWSLLRQHVGMSTWVLRQGPLHGGWSALNGWVHVSLSMQQTWKESLTEQSAIVCLGMKNMRSLLGSPADLFIMDE